MAEAYLERIGVPEMAEVDREYLNQLIVSHQQRIPFENIDVADFHMVPELEEKAIFEKVVVKKRGGYCFELNTLFEGLLKELGVIIYPVAVRVIWNRDFLPPASHMGLVAELDGKCYYCDVGFGGPGPKGLLALEKEEQQIGGEGFCIVTAEDGDRIVEKLHHGEWKKVLRFTEREIRQPDLQLLNFYCARCEKVRFSNTRVLNLTTPGGSKALEDCELTVRENGKEYKTICRNEKELEEVMAGEFGIQVTLPKEKEEIKSGT